MEIKIGPLLAKKWPLSTELIQELESNADKGKI
jgi:hypothetical protein